MGMTKEGMAAKIKTRLAAADQTVSEGPNAADPTNQLEAFCQGIIDEILANAVITTTSGAPNSEHTGNVSG